MYLLFVRIATRYLISSLEQVIDANCKCNFNYFFNSYSVLPDTGRNYYTYGMPPLYAIQLPCVVTLQFTYGECGHYFMLKRTIVRKNRQVISLGGSSGPSRQAGSSKGIKKKPITEYRQMYT